MILTPIQIAVERYFGVELAGADKRASGLVAKAQCVAYYLESAFAGRSDIEIAKLYGNRHRTTINKECARVTKGLKNKDPFYTMHVRALSERLVAERLGAEESMTVRELKRQLEEMRAQMKQMQAERSNHA